MASSKCCDNPPQLKPAGGEGKVIDSFGGLKAYVVGSDDCKAAVVLVSDVYDFLHGDPYMPGKTDRSLPVSVWVASHDPIKAFGAKPVIAALKDKGICTVGAAGYCLGAKIVVELAKSREIHAAVLLHPTFVTVDDIKEVKCPISILGAEIDKYSPPELMEQFKIVLSANYGVSHFVKIFPGVRHGWSVRYRDHDTAALKNAEEALVDMMDWFHKNLKLTLKLMSSM
ncbi:hypothetical protein QOZ80_5AG0374080 [Eleusine coracana subsp. coracana]|nr:hypothetical protein QOZ80_5AG0374080 [Eleusine coracana subsp. coracana]